MAQQEGRWEMVRDLEAERQTKGETVAERGARQCRKDNGKTRSERNSHSRLGTGPARFSCSLGKYMPRSYCTLSTGLEQGQRLNNLDRGGL